MNRRVEATFLALLILLAACQPASGNAPVEDAIPCEATERLTYHVHAQLAVFIEGRQVEIPADVGIEATCIYWLHTHDPSGTIHVEAPSPQPFRLGQFFRIWGQDLSAARLMDRRTDASHQIRAFVNAQPYAGDPVDIPLDAGATIVVAYGPPFPEP